MKRLSSGVPSTAAPAYGHHTVDRAHVRNLDRAANSADAAMLRERARIARELHDTVSQTLYAISLIASRTRRQLEQTALNEVRASIDDVLQLANSGQSEVRALLTNVRSESLAPGGLGGALARLASDARLRHGLDVRLSLVNEPDLPETTKRALVMISREVFHNIVRHASADHVEIVLEAAAETVMLLISDDGRGFNPATPRPGHFGLQTMRERAEAAGGIFEVSAAEGAGTRIRICIPCST